MRAYSLCRPRRKPTARRQAGPRDRRRPSTQAVLRIAPNSAAPDTLRTAHAPGAVVARATAGLAIRRCAFGNTLLALRPRPQLKQASCYQKRAGLGTPAASRRGRGSRCTCGSICNDLAHRCDANRYVPESRKHTTSLGFLTLSSCSGETTIQRLRRDRTPVHVGGRPAHRLGPDVDCVPALTSKFGTIVRVRGSAQ